MYLQLAENSSTPISDFYTFVPGSRGDAGVWVRNDEFDDLPLDEWTELMDMLEPYQPEARGNEQLGLFGLGKKARARREARQKARLERKSARTELIRSKAQGIQQGTFTPGKAIAGAFGGIKDLASNIFGGGGGSEPVEMMPGPGGEMIERERTPIYKNPIFLIGGAVVVGAVVYMATRKKKRK